MSNEILTQQDGAILRVTINRPEQGNGMTDPMVVELTGIIREAPKTSQIVVLRGAGKEFCIGRAGMGGARPATQPTAYTRRDFSDIVFDAYSAMRASPIPVIAVVQGKALGFGCAIAAGCDVTIASDAASFQVPEMAHNILPGMVMSSFIDRVTRKGMTYMVWSQAVITAERAATFGIVTEVVPAAQLDQFVDNLTGTILKAPPIAIRGVKEFSRVAYDMPLAGAVDYARNLHAVINSAEEIQRKDH